MTRTVTLISALLALAVLPAAAEARWQNSAGVFYEDGGSPLCKCRNGLRLHVAVNTNSTAWTAVRVIVTRSRTSPARGVLIDQVVAVAPVTPRSIPLGGGEVTVDHIAGITLRYPHRLRRGTNVVVYTQHAGPTPFDFGTVGAGTAIVLRTGSHLLAAARATTRCLGRRATIVGNRRANHLHGTPGNDVIVGLGGADVIDGRGGADLICAGSGNDRVVAGDGVVLGEAGNDRVIGGSVLLGGSGRDHLVAGSGGSVLAGGSGDDVLDGGAGADTLYGEQGRDLLRPGASPDTGGTGNQVVEGGPGDDTVQYQAGWDAIDGGAGRDLLRPAALASGFTVLLGPNAITGISEGSACLLKITDCVDAMPVVPYATPVLAIERVAGSDGADELHAPAASRVPYEIRGNGGDDAISGSDGPDVLIGGEGVDTVDGGAGHDTCGGETLVNCP
jgi:Ca2+-binding RTX toxin-like protein